MKPKQSQTAAACSAAQPSARAAAAHSQQDAPNLTGKALGEWASRAWRPVWRPQLNP